MNANGTGALWCWCHFILAVAPANGAVMLRGGERQFGRVMQQVCLPKFLVRQLLANSIGELQTPRGGEQFEGKK